MAAFINTNISSLNAQRNLTSSQGALATSLQRLSSGLRINSAKDDAAGLAISERMTSQIKGMNQAARNANDGISMSQTAEGDLVQIGNNLQRMRELAVQSSNASNSGSDRAALDSEFQALSTEIDRVSANSSFNGVKLLDGSFQSQAFQIGANNSSNDRITISSISSARTNSLGGFQGFSLTGQSIGTASDTAAAQSITVGGTTTSLGSIANDAKAIANAINSAGIAGLTASANATTVGAATQTVATTTAGTATITVNGLGITVNATTNATTNRANAVAALNAQSSVTGVVATDTGSGVSLAAADGRNITTAFALGTAVGTTMADFGMAAAGTTGATVNMTYHAPSGTTGAMTFTGAFNPGSKSIAATGTAVSAAKIDTAANAQTALDSIDNALAAVNTSRANLGAIQNRFSSVVSSLATTSENLSASRSRIQDADFAAETASLTRGQILQQAGTAMLAQANSLPNGVLALLRG
jgi:flagellin